MSGGPSQVAEYQCDIQKSLDQVRWTNRYMIRAGSLDAAEGIANNILAIERSVHNVIVFFDRMRVSTTSPGDDYYRIVNVGLAGLNSASGEHLPLFCVVRVDFGTGIGRPSRKYLRLPVMEGDQVNGGLTSGARAFFQETYAVPLVALDGFVDVDNQDIIDGTVQTLVGMRQLRRGSKRRLTNVI